MVSTFMILNNCRVLLHDKKVMGISLVSIGFFTIAGFWNAFFMFMMNQATSFVIYTICFLSQFTWLALALYYTFCYNPSRMVRMDQYT